MTPPPARDQIHYAVARAATVRRRRYQDDDRYRHFSDTAMAEQVCGVEGVLTDLGDGWWQVGTVVDVIAHVELDVLVNPAARKIRLREPTPMPERESPKPASLAPRQPALFQVPDERGRNRLKWDEW